jgi:hypothetical protein
VRTSFLRITSFLFLVLMSGALVLSPFIGRSIHAQRPDLLAAAARFPKFTSAQRRSVLRERQSELHPTWKDLSLGEAAQRLLRFATQAVSSTQPPMANFMGNTTSINSPSGTALALSRQSNCSLELLYGTYSVSFTSPGYTITNTTANYEQVLHAAANLTTTADQFSSGCADATQGLTTRRAVYVGKTPSGANVFGAYVYNAAAEAPEIYGVVINSSYVYQSSAALATGALPIGILTGDLNKDGLGDLASVNNPLAATDAPTVSIFLGNTDGSFKPGTNVTLAGNVAISGVMDDFNNDGIEDIVVATETLPSTGNTIAYQINFLAGKGDGTFQPAQSVAIVPPAGTSNPYFGLTSASLRGNGNKDLVTSQGIVLLGNGDGTFTQSSTAAFPSSNATSDFGPNIAAADFNKDGKIDLAVDDGQTINIYNGNGDGTFSVGSAYASIDNVGYLTATDLDGDGNIDLYSGLANGGFFGGDQFGVNAAYALMGNGNGTFQGAPATPFVFTGTNLADLNGDGKLDGVGVDSSLNSSNVSFTTYLGKGDGTFTSKSTVAVSPITIQGNSYSFLGIDSFDLGDFNGDGNVDLIYLPKAFYGPTGETGYFLASGDGSGNVQTPAFIPAPSFVSAGDHDNHEQLSNLLVADFNHDGKPDILYNYTDEGSTSQTYYQGIAVQLGNGDGTFKTPLTIQTYSSTTIPSGVPQPLVVQIGDANQDGIPDIFVLVTNVVPSGLATQLELYLGKGDGTFASPSTPPVADQINPPTFGSSLGQIVLADVNGDGHTDLLTLGTTNNGLLGELAVSLGNGDGTFASPKILDFGGGSSLGYGIAVADFNGDGKPDVFVGGFTPPYDTGIFLGNGDGTFQSSTNSDGAVQPAQAIELLAWGPALATDFNGDGKVDVLGGDAVLLNLGVSSSTGPTTGAAATTTSLSASSSTVAQGAAFTLTATVSGAGSSGTPTGTVTFYDGTTQLGTAPIASGAASFSTSSLAAGAHSITASYGGDTNYMASTSSPITVTVSTLVATVTTLMVSQATATTGTNVEFVATVAAVSGSGIPTGTVTFIDGTTTLGTAKLSSAGAIYSTASLASGTHSVTASYQGDANDASSVSSPVTLAIASPPASYSLSLNPASGSVAASGSTTTSITITPVNGFNQMVSFACSGLPAETTCAFAPSTVTPGGGPVATTMTVTTGATASLAQPTTPSHGGKLPFAWAGGVLSLAFLGTRRRTRSRLLSWVAICALGVTALGIGSCSAGSGGGSGSAAAGGGGSNASSGTAAGTSVVTITATSGSISQAATYTLIVQ